MLVGGILFEIVTGLMNIQYDYAFGFSFYTAHYIGAWVFIAGLRRARRAEAARRAAGVADAVAARRAAACRPPRRSPSTTAWWPPIPHRRR